ncbi:MAG TPA: DUF1461 domain-containing protein [Gammaproteobacteria bacterium]|nr:DUF1461 domain-containing protein [Gammaproteobacteria bacterium]
MTAAAVDPTARPARNWWTLAGWLTLLPILLLALLSISWELLAWGNFGYRTLHQLIDIEATISEYGPQNRLRPGFQFTSLDERSRLFGEIVDAIHQRGEGLAELVYRHADGRPLGPLLTPAEIVHLQDVAQLVSRLRPLGWAAAVITLLATAVIVRQRLLVPWRLWLAGIALLGVVSMVLLLLFGAEPLFYQLHRWWFPPDHQWFFYYEESLMSMMMQAPNLFGAIAVGWLLLVLLLGAGWWQCVRHHSGANLNP